MLAQDAVAALQHAIDDLETAAQFLEEFGSIGVWVTSDDCSDNRNKRKALKEAGWAAHHALVMLADVQTASGVETLVERLRALDAQLEPLPAEVSDIMAGNPQLDLGVSKSLEQIEELVKDAKGLLGRP